MPKTPTQIRDKLKGRAPPQPRGPVWKGPSEDGVTFSLLSRYLNCKERFRIHVMDGLQPHEQFYAPFEYGSMWHAMEEALAAGKSWEQALANYHMVLARKFPTDRAVVGEWAAKAQALFWHYIEYWKNHPDMKGRTPVLQEQVFNVQYSLPSSRTVRLRGKWDSVDLVEEGGRKSIWLQENKTKSQMDGVKIARQLTFDLQTMLYLVALTKWQGEQAELRKYPISGVRYNCVRRSAHKSVEAMLKKLSDDCNDDRHSEWFARWNVGVTPADIARFAYECLNPILENLLDDYEWWECCYKERQDHFTYQVRQDLFPHHQARHYRHPFGVYNVLDEGGCSDLDAYLLSGSTVGLTRTNNLFPELT